MGDSKFGEGRVSDNRNGIFTFSANQADGVSAEYANNMQQRLKTVLETVGKASALKPADADYTKAVTLLQNFNRTLGTVLGNEQKHELNASISQDSDDVVSSAPSLAR